MLLRRVIAHFRKQEWTAIALDFLIVVVGVFIGIQFNNWNETRIERGRERVYLQQLTVEVATMDALIADVMKAHDRRIGSMRNTLAALKDCEMGAATLDDIEYAFAEYQNVQPLQVIDSAYSEMVSSGMLASLDDNDLRRSISEYYTRLNGVQLTAAQVRLSLPTVDAIVWEHIDLTYDEDGALMLIDFRLEDACKERKLKNAVVEMIDMHSDWRNFLNRMTAPGAELVQRLRDLPEAEGLQ